MICSANINHPITNILYFNLNAGLLSKTLSVKRFDDAKATVIRHLPGAGKHEGRLGAVLVELSNGI